MLKGVGGNLPSFNRAQVKDKSPEGGRLNSREAEDISLNGLLANKIFPPLASVPFLLILLILSIYLVGLARMS